MKYTPIATSKNGWLQRLSASSIKMQLDELSDTNNPVYQTNGRRCSSCIIKDSRGCSQCLTFIEQNGDISLTVADIDDPTEHCHDDELRHDIDKKARKKLWIASVLCVIFMIGETVGGLLAGSLAVATDAAHLLTDFAGFMISLFAMYISERPATKSLSFGYHRAEVIGALTSVLLIWVVTGILVYLAIERLIHREFEINAPIMLVTSGVGLLINIIMGCTLHQHSHSHGGGHKGHGHHEINCSSSSETSIASFNGNKKPETAGQNYKSTVTNHGDNEYRIKEMTKSIASEMTKEDGDPVSFHSMNRHSHRVGASQPNINVRAAFIHVLGDFLQSTGVFAAALVIYFKPTWVIVDPICTFLFSFLVLGTSYAIIKDAVFVLMEGIPKGIDFNDVRETILHVKGVKKVHNLRIWSLSMDKIAFSAHLAIDPGTCNANTVLRKSSQLMKYKYGFCEVTIQIEDFNQSMQDCRKCQELN